MRSPAARKGLILVGLLAVSLGLYRPASTGSTILEAAGLVLLAALAVLAVWSK